MSTPQVLVCPKCDSPDVTVVMVQVCSQCNSTLLWKNNTLVEKAQSLLKGIWNTPASDPDSLVEDEDGFKVWIGRAPRMKGRISFPCRPEVRLVGDRMWGGGPSQPTPIKTVPTTWLEELELEIARSRDGVSESALVKTTREPYATVQDGLRLLEADGRVYKVRSQDNLRLTYHINPSYRKAPDVFGRDAVLIHTRDDEFDDIG